MVFFVNLGMTSHTLILSAPKINIPESNIIDFAKGLIISNLVNIDYFGIENDNQADYIDELMQETINNTTYLTFHFDKEGIDYENSGEVETLQFVVDLLDEKNIGRVIVEENNIEFFINHCP